MVRSVSSDVPKKKPGGPKRGGRVSVRVRTWYVLCGDGRVCTMSTLLRVAEEKKRTMTIPIPIAVS